MKDKGYTFQSVAFWKVTAGLALASFFIFASLYTVQPLLPVFADKFHISPGLSSLAQSLTVISLAIGLIAFGFYSDRWGRVRIIQFSLLGAILPFILIPLANSFTLLLVFRFLQGFALAGLPAAAVAYISEEVDGEYSSFAVSVYVASNALGGMAGRALTGYIAGQYNWRAAFYFFAVIGVLIFLGLFFLLPKSRFFQPARESFSKEIQNLFAHLGNHILIPTFGLGLILQFSFTGIWTYMPFYLQAPPFSLSLETTSYFYFAYIFGVVGAPLGGYLTRRFGLGRVMLFGIFTFAFGILISVFSSLASVAVALSVICFGFFIAHSMASAWVGRTARHHKGSASSMYLMSYYIGVALGGTLLGPLWTSFHWNGLVMVTMILPILYAILWGKFSLSKEIGK